MANGESAADIQFPSTLVPQTEIEPVMEATFQSSRLPQIDFARDLNPRDRWEIIKSVRHIMGVGNDPNER